MKRAGKILVFVLLAVVVQGMALLFLTPAGLEYVYAVPLRMQAEKIQPESNTYAAYYDMRVAASQADLIVVGIDREIAQSYDLLGHFSRFLKQYNNFSDVLLDMDKVQRRTAAGVMEETDERQFYAKLDTLQEACGLSADACDYLAELFVINRTMPPVRKFSLDSYSAAASEQEQPVWKRIARQMNAQERSALCVVDAQLFSAGSDFRKELEQALPDREILFVQTLYTPSCPSPETHDTVRFLAEGKEEAVYFVNNEDLTSFYHYYEGVTGLFGSNADLNDRLHERYTAYFFVVSRGTAVRYADTQPKQEWENNDPV